MKIKLRLSMQDMDLIALKHNRDFQYADAIRIALTTYAETGSFAKITVPDYTDYHIVMKPETVEFVLNPKKHKNAIFWVLSIQSGLRNRAIKTLIRCSITNLPLWVFKSDADITYAENPNKKSRISGPNEVDRSQEEGMKGSIDDPEYSKRYPFAGVVQEQITINESGEEELDLLDFDFENY